jgi:hypothetical protein
MQDSPRFRFDLTTDLDTFTMVNFFAGQLGICESDLRENIIASD